VVVPGSVVVGSLELSGAADIWSAGAIAGICACVSVGDAENKARDSNASKPAQPKTRRQGLLRMALPFPNSEHPCPA
jgi:hypothetical protein